VAQHEAIRISAARVDGASVRQLFDVDENFTRSVAG
jgi:hypothetical protein